MTFSYFIAAQATVQVGHDVILDFQATIERLLHEVAQIRQGHQTGNATAAQVTPAAGFKFKVSASPNIIHIDYIENLHYYRFSYRLKLFERLSKSSLASCKATTLGPRHTSKQAKNVVYAMALITQIQTKSFLH